MPKIEAVSFLEAVRDCSHCQKNDLSVRWMYIELEDKKKIKKNHYSGPLVICNFVKV
jgi:hypothetical protein